MAFGIPYPRFRATRNFPLPQEELPAAIKWTLEDLGWPYKIVGDTQFQARIPTTNWSWHHELKVTIHPACLIEAQSKSAYQEMFIDLGRNKANVEIFFARLDQGIRHELYRNPVPARDQEFPEHTGQSVPRSRANALLGGCFVVLILLIPVVYFISAVIGLLTGNLFLPSRGSGGGTIHGLWARIISAIILAIFAWALIWLWRKRNLHR
jgi:hypothetical protein